MIYDQSSCFDPATAFQEGMAQSENDFSKTHMDDEQQSSYPHNLDMDLQNQEMQSMIDHHNKMVQEMVQNPNWQEMNNTFNNGGGVPNGNGTDHHAQNGHFTETLYPTTPDLLNMFPLPRCSTSAFLPNSNSINFSNTSSVHKASSSFLASLGLFGGDLNSPVGAEGGSSGSNGVLYDSMLPVNLQPQPPLLKELFHSLPYANSSHGSLFGGVEYDRDSSGGLMYQDGGDGRGLDNGVFMFTSGEMNCLGKNRDGKEDVKHFATERHRRVQLNTKFQTLRNLIPQPTKNDRASIVGDAIEYINELKRTVNELKSLMERKRCARERLKRPKAEEEGILEQNGSNSPGDMENPFNGSSLRSSWLHRKSKNTEVDVRIIDDEVNVKLVQQKRVNCLLFVSRVLDELQLDLHHVAGGLIGDYYSFLFNSKISEGSIVYASAIADKLIEVVDKQYAAIPPTNSY